MNDLRVDKTREKNGHFGIVKIDNYTDKNRKAS